MRQHYRLRIHGFFLLTKLTCESTTLYHTPTSRTSTAAADPKPVPPQPTMPPLRRFPGSDGSEEAANILAVRAKSRDGSVGANGAAALAVSCSDAKQRDARSAYVGEGGRQGC